VRIGKFTFSDPCWAHISNKAKDLIYQLLTYDTKMRPSASEALQHPWITEMSKQTVDMTIAVGALNNLKIFRADQKLKQATFAFIAS
jgi:calcium-dependent protein kinase